MDIFEGKNKQYCKRLTKFGRNKVLRIKPRAAMFVNFKSRALPHEPSSDCVIARAKVRVRAQASYGNITVLSHLKFICYISMIARPREIFNRSANAVNTSLKFQLT